MIDATDALRVIDGKAMAARLLADLKNETAALRAEGCQPGLAVVLVGEDPASQVYVRNKIRQTEEAGMASFEYRLPDTTAQDELLALIARLNLAADVHGILVQLPLPQHIDEQAVLHAIAPDKDVDGFHPVNVGLLATGQPAFAPCTPVGAMALIRSVREDISGMHAVVIGRSNIVGKPMAQLLLAANCTVTIAHSRTRDLAALCGTADILVAAVGRPAMVRGNWVKPGAIVIDIGINRIAGPDGRSHIVGDVAFEEASARAGAITPVPGGAGPMTIACLLQNTVQAARRQKGG